MALLGALVPVVGVSAPAVAADCQDETHQGLPLFETGCDDVTPPETTVVATTPALTPRGYVAGSTVRFDFTGSYGTTGDSGPIAFQCQFYDTTTAPTTWTACTSPQVFSGLAQSGATPYTFRVRAVDANDEAIAACDATPGCLGDEEVVDDEDATPATVAFKVDTTVPNTFITRGPHDEIRPDWPVTLTRRPQLVLNSNEAGAEVRCELNGKPLPCGQGVLTFKRLRSGSQVFTARAVDAAGNADPVPATTTFFVPVDLKARPGWKAVRSSRAFDADLVTTSKAGAVLRVGHQRNVRELRLIAPAGPRLGTVQVKVGHSRWYTVSLRGRTANEQTYVVRDQFAPPQSGAVTIRVLSVPRGGSVQLDALVARG